MNTANLIFKPATFKDFAYLYALCETTMRNYVEADWGDCFEQIARPTITRLVAQGLFSKVYANDVCVGVIASEQHPTHYQLEELYVEPAHQQSGIGTAIVQRVIAEATAHGKPIHLQVLASNPARTFWEKNGFVVTHATSQVYCMERKL